MWLCVLQQLRSVMSLHKSLKASGCSKMLCISVYHALDYVVVVIFIGKSVLQML